MKMNKLVLLCSSLAVAAAFTACEKKQPVVTTTTTTEPTLAQKTETAMKSAADKTKEVASDTKAAIGAKLTEWKLTPGDIKADLEKGGRVVRTKTAAAGEKIGGAVDNARIVTVVNAKLVGDSELSALKINVDADKSVVTLKGTASSVENIGRAIALALDTEGVTEVVSLLTVKTTM